MAKKRQLETIFKGDEVILKQAHLRCRALLYALVEIKLMFGSIAFIIAVFSIGIFSAHALEAFAQSSGRR
jgi:hypothetical protein